MINNWLKNTQNWFQKYAFCCYLCHDNTTSDQLICDLCWRDLMTDDDGQVCDRLHHVRLALLPVAGPERDAIDAGNLIVLSGRYLTGTPVPAP